MKILTTALSCTLLTYSCISFAKTQNYHYSDDMCEYKNTFDGTKISKKQIKDSLNLITLATSMKLSIEDYGFSLHQPPSTHTLKSTEQLYLKAKTDLSALSPAPQAKYQNLKNIVLRQLKDEYEFYDLKLKAYQNPKVLLTQRYGQTCYAIAQRMNQQDADLIRTSRALTIEYVEQQRKQGLQYPEWYQEQIQRFDREIKQANNK